MRPTSATDEQETGTTDRVPPPAPLSASKLRRGSRPDPVPCLFHRNSRRRRQSLDSRSSTLRNPALVASTAVKAGRAEDKRQDVGPDAGRSIHSREARGKKFATFAPRRPTHPAAP